MKKLKEIHCKWYEICPMKLLYEKNLIDVKYVEQYCWVSNPNCIRYQLDSKGEYHPDNMLPDGSIRDDLPTQIENIK